MAFTVGCSNRVFLLLSIPFHSVLMLLLLLLHVDVLNTYKIFPNNFMNLLFSCLYCMTLSWSFLTVSCNVTHFSGRLYFFFRPSFNSVSTWFLLNLKYRKNISHLTCVCVWDKWNFVHLFFNSSTLLFCLLYVIEFSDVL